MAVVQVPKGQRWEGRWRARVVRYGKKRQAICRTQREAREAERRIEEELEAEFGPRAAELQAQLKRERLEALTFRAYAEEWVQRRTDVASGTKDADEVALRIHLLGEFGDMRLADIGKREIENFRARKLETHAPNSVSAYLRVLGGILRSAADDGVISAAPKFKGPRKPETDFDYLREDELADFLSAAGEHHEALALAIGTGLRIGELRGLQWGDIDLDNRTLRVARQLHRNGSFASPKGRRPRTVDLEPGVVALLRQLQPAKVRSSELVLRVSGRVIERACEQAAKGAGLGRKITPHDLRHTFASLHAAKGTPLHVIQAWLGHASINQTLKYSHLCPRTSAQFASVGILGSAPNAAA